MTNEPQASCKGSGLGFNPLGPAEADEENEMTKAANICALTVIMMLGLAAPAAAATQASLTTTA